MTTRKTKRVERSKELRACLFLVTLFLTLTEPCRADAIDSEIEISVSPQVLDGANPGITLDGVKPKQPITVHTLRRLGKWVRDDAGNWIPEWVVLHAWAEFVADENGRIRIDTAVPINGTYSVADPLALLVTGFPIDHSKLNTVHPFDEERFADAESSDVFIKVERDGEIVTSTRFELVTEPDELTFQTVSEPGLNGVFARPNTSNSLPVVISLHGSEGGSAERARVRAAQFASNGFATLAINYFAHSDERLNDVPTEHREIPLEIVDNARTWLANRVDVNLDRIHLYGVSRGAEFALLAATKYDWISSIVAVVPSDVVWPGYDNNFVHTDHSAWSFQGEPVPFIPLFELGPQQEGMYRELVEGFSRARDFYSDQETHARIPIETTSLRLLLLASDQDEVWPSGEMARNLVERMIDAGKREQVSVRIFPRAGHQIAGTGTFPPRLYSVDSNDPLKKDIMAEVAAAGEAWRLTLNFLKY